MNRETYRPISEVRHAAGGKVGAEGLKRAIEIIEEQCPIGVLLSTLAVDPFTPVMVDVARDRPEPEVLAWMTLAAAGSRRARRAVAMRAARIVPPHELIETLVAGGDLRAAFEVRAEASTNEDEWGAWLLLSRLGKAEIENRVKRRAPLRRRLVAARRAARRPVNQGIAGQLRALGLV